MILIHLSELRGVPRSESRAGDLIVRRDQVHDLAGGGQIIAQYL